MTATIDKSLDDLLAESKERNAAEAALGALEIHDTNRDGTLEIVDTNWDGNGGLRVTVRELVGHGCYAGDFVRNARRLARKALPEYFPGQTRKSPVINRFTADGCDHVTFNVSRVR